MTNGTGTKFIKYYVATTSTCCRSDTMDPSVGFGMLDLGSLGPHGNCSALPQFQLVLLSMLKEYPTELRLRQSRTSSFAKGPPDSTEYGGYLRTVWKQFPRSFCSSSGPYSTFPNVISMESGVHMYRLDDEENRNKK